MHALFMVAVHRVHIQVWSVISCRWFCQVSLREQLQFCGISCWYHYSSVKSIREFWGS